MKKEKYLLFLLAFLFALLFCSVQTKADPVTITNGITWYDTDSLEISAHEYGMCKEGDYYYWFGNNCNDNLNWLSVRCYRSTDLKNWEFRNDVLTPSSHPALASRLMQRPKVIYCPNTDKYVMWMKSIAGTARQCAVAVCDTIDGDYQFLYHFNPFGDLARDSSLFREGNDAYFISAGSDNWTITIYKLTPDFLDVECREKPAMWTMREAPTMFKREGYYFLITSGCTGWAPNQQKYSYASSLSGSWADLQDLGGGASDDLQATFVVPIQYWSGGSPEYLFMADRFFDPQTEVYNDSTYVWLPLSFPTTTSVSYTYSSQITVDTGPIDDPTAPVAPTNLSAAAGNSFVSLNWDDNTEIDLGSYSVYRATSTGGPYTEIASTLYVSDYFDDTAVNGTTYYYVVTAIDKNDNESNNSTEAYAIPQSSTGPGFNFFHQLYSGERNNFTGWVGYEFTPNRNITIDSLGRAISGSLNYNHDVKIWRVSDQTVVVQTTITALSPIDSLGYAYEELGSTALLTQNVTYRIASYETSGGDAFFDIADISNHANSADIDQGVWGTDTYPDRTNGGADTGYVPATFYEYHITSIPPTPNPATFASAPSAISDTAISMTATTGSDDNGPIEYHFYELTGNPGATDSGWQTSPNYTDSGLDPSTLYIYIVQMRDSLSHAGTVSEPVRAVTYSIPNSNFFNKSYTGSRNNYTGWLGYEFVLYEDITIDSLGRAISGSLNYNHDIKIWRVSDQTLVAQATITPSSSTDFLDYAYEGLGSTVTLYKDVTYRIASYETSGGDEFHDIYDSDISNHATVAYITTGVYGTGDYPANTNGPIEHGYVPPTFYIYTDDTTAPASPTNLSATGGDGSVSLDWDDNTEFDLHSYNVYRHTTSGGPYTQIETNVTNSDYIDNTVTNDITYYYVVTAVDTSTNESNYSNEVSAIPQAGAEPDMYVNDISMGYRKQGQKYYGQTTVWIKDDTAANVEGATVYGDWSGATTESEVGTTQADGTVFFESSGVRNGGTFTFTVTDVVKSGYVYNSSLNIETSDSITVP